MRRFDIASRPDVEFKRHTAVTRPAFARMVEIYRIALLALWMRGKNNGRPHALPAEDEVYLLLIYYRECRLFLHTGRAFGVPEPTAWRVVRRVESALVSHPDFHPPGKKALQDARWETFAVDAIGVDIERPRKHNGALRRQKEAIQSESAGIALLCGGADRLFFRRQGAGA